MNEPTDGEVEAANRREHTVTFARAQNLSVSRRRPMTKVARVYKIEMLIRNRGHVSFKELLDELEVSPATLKVGVRDAYPDVDFDKPFSEFTAARSTLQPSLDGLGR